MATSPGDLAALHAIIGFPIVAFIPFLMLKYHKPDASPFDDISIIILVFFIATLTYVAAMLTEFKLGVECPKIINRVSHLSAPLASLSLVTIFFPYLGWFLFVIWIGCFGKLALDFYQEFYQLLRNATRCAHDIIWNKLLRHEANVLPFSTTHVSTSEVLERQPSYSRPSPFNKAEYIATMQQENRKRVAKVIAASEGAKWARLGPYGNAAASEPTSIGEQQHYHMDQVIEL